MTGALVMGGMVCAIGAFIAFIASAFVTDIAPDDMSGLSDDEIVARHMLDSNQLGGF